MWGRLSEMEHLDQATSLHLEHIDPFLMQSEQEHQSHLLASGSFSGALDALQHIPTSYDRTNGDSTGVFDLASPNMHPHSLENGVAPMSVSPDRTHSAAFETITINWDEQNPSRHVRIRPPWPYRALILMVPLPEAKTYRFGYRGRSPQIQENDSRTSPSTGCGGPKHDYNCRLSRIGSPEILWAREALPMSSTAYSN